MISRATTCFLLAAVALQGVFGGLRESVVICIGGGHTHEAVEVVEHHEHDCGHHHHEHHHHDEAPTQTTHDDHAQHCCDCTDIELDLIVLISKPRTKNTPSKLIPATPTFMACVADQSPWHSQWRGPPPDPEHDDPGQRLRLAVLRSTQLLL